MDDQSRIMKRPATQVLLILTAAGLAVLVSAAHAASQPPYTNRPSAGQQRGTPLQSQTARRIVFNRRIGSLFIGETDAAASSTLRSLQEVGSGSCLEMIWKPYSCVAGSTGNYVVTVYHHGVPSLRHLDVWSYQGRIVYLFTDSEGYKTRDGLGVGSRLPYGKKGAKIILDRLDFTYVTVGCGCWHSPRSHADLKTLRKKSATYLISPYGLVNAVVIMRGDVSPTAATVRPPN